MHALQTTHLLLIVWWRVLDGEVNLGLAKLLLPSSVSHEVMSNYSLVKHKMCSTLHVSFSCSASASSARCT